LVSARAINEASIDGNIALAFGAHVDWSRKSGRRGPLDDPLAR
jgi:hypothetical protein